MVTPNLRLERLLGEGAMGSVWVATHLGLDASVAVKFISPVRLRDKPALVARFEREAKAAARIKSPHVVQVHDHGVMADDTPYIVMELLEGETLGARLRRGPMPIDEIATVVTHVGKALEKAHQLGIVHRDIKPENIFLTDGQDELCAKVLDFGIAKQLEEPGQTMTQTGAILGTPMYMSPERIKSAREADVSADLWALAVVAYECVTGRTPFAGETVGALFFAICGDPLKPASELRDGVPAALDDWFSRALRHELDRRFATARELAAAFQRALGRAPDAALAGDGTAIEPALASSGHEDPLMATSEFLSKRELTIGAKVVATKPSTGAINSAGTTDSAGTIDSRSTLEQAPLLRTTAAPANSAVTPDARVTSDAGTSATVSRIPAASTLTRLRRFAAPIVLVAVAATGAIAIGLRSWRDPGAMNQSPSSAAVSDGSDGAATAGASASGTATDVSTSDGAAPSGSSDATSHAKASAEDEQAVRKTVASAVAPYRVCNTDYRKRTSSYRGGTLQIAVVVRPDGALAEAIAGGMGDRIFADCITDAVRALKFRATGARIDVVYPLVFNGPVDNRSGKPGTKANGKVTMDTANTVDRSDNNNYGAPPNGYSKLGQGSKNKKVSKPVAPEKPQEQSQESRESTQLQKEVAPNFKQ